MASDSRTSDKDKSPTTRPSPLPLPLPLPPPRRLDSTQTPSESQPPRAPGPTQPTESTSGGGQEYSNEARAYHARYAELNELYDQGRLDRCRQGCLDLLTEPRLPKYTRVQTLQMVSTLLRPAGAKSCLLDAAKLLDSTSPEKFQTRLLKEDNDNMLHDLNLWQDKGEQDGGEDGEVDDDVPSEKWIQHEAEIEEELQREARESGQDGGQVEDGERRDAEVATPPRTSTS